MRRNFKRENTPFFNVINYRFSHITLLNVRRKIYYAFTFDKYFDNRRGFSF